MTRFEPLLAGQAEGDVLILRSPISIWGGIDEDTGTIVDAQHPDRDMSVSGRVVWLPGLRGSGGTPGALASLIRAGRGPSAILMPSGDANLLCGLIVGQRLYGTLVPYLVGPQPPASARVAIRRDGTCVPAEAVERQPR